MKKTILSILLAFLGIAAFSQEKGEWRTRLRATYVIPDAHATISTIGGSVDISKTVIPELDFTYFFLDRVSANLILGTTRHKVTATNTALGDVELGRVWLLPPTLTLLYHQPLGAGIVSYLGAGVNYTLFYGKRTGPAIADISYKNRAGFATQLGVDIDVANNWFLNIDAKKIWLKTENTVSTVPAVAGGATVHADTKIDPWLLSVGVGLKF